MQFPIGGYYPTPRRIRLLSLLHILPRHSLPNHLIHLILPMISDTVILLLIMMGLLAEQLAQIRKKDL